ncbi:MAG TPA: hypothetical protein PKM73_02835 [Verrucomicrobiota bacterium]|nr:hypothetical protein [Verrucomicrobiota bacterium]HNU49640.1 hypothetical protein [Verrucomicrobiota bacterium]
MKTKVELTEAMEQEWPVCPHCKKELRELKFRKRGWLTTLMVFWCPHCRSLLSTSMTFNG